VLEIVARGEQRFRILEHRAQADGLIRASVELVLNETDAEIPVGCAACVQLLERVITQHPALFEEPHRLDSSAWVSARLAEILPLPLALKQQLLETSEGRARLEHLASLLRPEQQPG
jgi:uncharacterized protein